MLERIIVAAVLIAAAYWYWQGPYQDRVNPSYELQLENNARAMAECERAKAYQLGATGSGSGPGGARSQCARQYNLYFEDGHWHSYDSVRRD